MKEEAGSQKSLCLNLNLNHDHTRTLRLAQRRPRSSWRDISTACHSESRLIPGCPMVLDHLALFSTDQTLTSTLFAFSRCLSDACPLVRVAAVGCVTRLFDLWWEMIPSATIAWLANKLTGQGAVRRTRQRDLCCGCCNALYVL